MGFEVVSMAEQYGQKVAQEIDDVDWIPEVTQYGLVIFSKDNALRSGEGREAIIRCGARVFLVPDTQATARVQVERYETHRYRIAQRAQKPGPMMFILRPRHLEKDDLDVP